MDGEPRVLEKGEGSDKVMKFAIICPQDVQVAVEDQDAQHKHGQLKMTNSVNAFYVNTYILKHSIT